MKKRQLVIIGTTILILLLGYAGMKLLASQKKEPQKKASNESIRAVKTIVIELDTIAMKFPIQGKVVAGRKLEIYSEVTGRLLQTEKQFKIGTTYNEGDVLLAIDGRESLLNLKSQRSAFMNIVSQVLPDIKIDYEKHFETWNTFLAQIDPNKPLPDLPTLSDSKLKNLLSGRSIFQQYYAIKSLENRQSKFRITAPFTGTLSQGDLNAGTLIRAGQKMGELMSNTGYEFQGAIAVSDAPFVKIGDRIELSNGLLGKVSRIALNADPSTQQVIIYASLPANSVAEGSYIEGALYAKDIYGAASIDRNLINPNGSAFFVSGDKLIQKDLEIVHLYEKTAIIKGVENGDLLLNQAMEGAFEGMSVKPLAE